MRVTVRLFGFEADALGQRTVTIEVPDQELTCGRLAQGLAEAEPKLAQRPGSCRLAVNHEFAVDDRRIGPDDEVALIGMVSGG